VLMTADHRQHNGNSEPLMKPWRAKFAEKRAAEHASRKSAPNARPNPPPIAAPWTAATIGSGCSNSRIARPGHRASQLC
jgi:hypothetical protein